MSTKTVATLILLLIAWMLVASREDRMTVKIEIREAMEVDEEVASQLAAEGRNRGFEGTHGERVREVLREAMVQECVAAKFRTGKYRDPWKDERKDATVGQPTDNPTICVACRHHVYAMPRGPRTSTNEHLCCHPSVRREGVRNFVDGTIWYVMNPIKVGMDMLTPEPMPNCCDINDGNCRLYEAKD